MGLSDLWGGHLPANDGIQAGVLATMSILLSGALEHSTLADHSGSENQRNGTKRVLETPQQCEPKAQSRT